MAHELLEKMAHELLEKIENDCKPDETTIS